MRIECKFQKSHKKLHVSSNSLLLWYSILSQMVLFFKSYLHVFKDIYEEDWKVFSE